MESGKEMDVNLVIVAVTKYMEDNGNKNEANDDQEQTNFLCGKEATLRNSPSL